MTQDPNNNKHYIAAEGKVFQRINNGFDPIKKPFILGSELFLGQILVDNRGRRLMRPVDDKIEYYEEIVKPVKEEETPENTEEPQAEPEENPTGE